MKRPSYPNLYTPFAGRCCFNCGIGFPTSNAVTCLSSIKGIRDKVTQADSNAVTCLSSLNGIRDKVTQAELDVSPTGRICFWEVQHESTH